MSQILFELIPDPPEPPAEEGDFGLTADEIRLIRESARNTPIDELSAEFDLDYDLVDDIVYGRVASLAGGCLRVKPKDVALNLADHFAVRVLQTAEMAMSAKMFERVLDLNGIRAEDYYRMAEALGDVNEKWQYHKLVRVPGKEGTAASKEQRK